METFLSKVTFRLNTQFKALVWKSRNLFFILPTWNPFLFHVCNYRLSFSFFHIYVGVRDNHKINQCETFLRNPKLKSNQGPGHCTGSVWKQKNGASGWFSTQFKNRAVGSFALSCAHRTMSDGQATEGNTVATDSSERRRRLPEIHWQQSWTQATGLKVKYKYSISESKPTLEEYKSIQ